MPFPDLPDFDGDRLKKALKDALDKQEREEKERQHREWEDGLARAKFLSRYNHPDKPNLSEIAKNYAPSTFVKIHCYLVSRKKEWRFFSSNFYDRAHDFYNLVIRLADEKPISWRRTVQYHIQNNANKFKTNLGLSSQRYYDLLMELNKLSYDEVEQQFYIYGYCLKESVERFGYRGESRSNYIVYHFDDEISFGIFKFLQSLEQKREYKVEHGVKDKSYPKF